MGRFPIAVFLYAVLLACLTLAVAVVPAGTEWALVAQWDGGGNALDLEGDLLFVSGDHGFSIRNVSDLRNPQVVSRWTGPDSPSIAVRASGAFAYYVTIPGYFAVLSIGDPPGSQPTLETAFLTFNVTVRDLEVSQQTVVIVGQEMAGPAPLGAIIGIDVSIPALPREAFRVYTYNPIFDCAVRSGALYTVDDAGDLRSWRILPSGLEPTDTLHLSDSLTGIDVDDENAVVTSGSNVFSVAIGRSLVLVDQLVIPDRAAKVALVPGKAFVSAEANPAAHERRVGELSASLSGGLRLLHTFVFSGSWAPVSYALAISPSGTRVFSPGIADIAVEALVPTTLLARNQAVQVALVLGGAGLGLAVGVHLIRKVAGRKTREAPERKN